MSLGVFEGAEGGLELLPPSGNEGWAQSAADERQQGLEQEGPAGSLEAFWTRLNMGLPVRQALQQRCRRSAWLLRWERPHASGSASAFSLEERIFSRTSEQ